MTPLPRWPALRQDWRPLVRRLAPWLLPALGGALLFALFGTVPARLERADVRAGAWVLPGPVDRTAADVAAAAVWAERHPWGGAPAASESAEAVVPAPVPVAIVSTARGHEAIFVVSGAGEVRTRAGDTLPDGGRVEQVDALSVTWTDAQGQRQEQHLLADRQRPLAGASSSAAAAGASSTDTPRPRRSRRARNP